MFVFLCSKNNNNNNNNKSWNSSLNCVLNSPVRQIEQNVVYEFRQFLTEMIIVRQGNK